MANETPQILRGPFLRTKGAVEVEYMLDRISHSLCISQIHEQSSDRPPGSSYTCRLVAKSVCEGSCVGWNLVSVSCRVKFFVHEKCLLVRLSIIKWRRNLFCLGVICVGLCFYRDKQCHFLSLTTECIICYIVEMINVSLSHLNIKNKKSRWR